MNEYEVLPGPLDEHGKRKAWIMRNGSCWEMKGSVSAASRAVNRLNQGLEPEHEPDPETMANMEEEVPE